MNNQLSSATRNKIANVVETAFKASLGGENPTQALAKAASEANLTMPQTLRACEALNVSSTLHHNKTADITSKTASFDIADPDMLSGIMFPSELPVKEASYVANNGSYDLGSYKLDFGELEIAEPEMAEDTADTIYKRSSAAILKGQSCLNSAEAQELEAIHGVDQQLEKIAGMVGGLYGDASASIEDEDIREYVNGLINKAASTKPAREPSTLLVDAVEHLKDMFKVAGECAQITAEVRQEVEGLKKLSADVRYMALGTDSSPIPTKFGPIDVAKFVNPVMGALLSGKTQSRKARDTIKSNFEYNPYNDPMFSDVTQTRSMLQNAVMLSQMMKEDPVLKNANPKNVVGAFNSIFSTMPQLSANPELTRAALRYSVESGGMDYPTMISAMKDAENISSDKTRIAELSAKQGEKNKQQLEIYNTLISDRDKRLKDDEAKLVEKKEKIKAEGVRVRERDTDRTNALILQHNKSKADAERIRESREYSEGQRAESKLEQEAKDEAKEQENKGQAMADATERKIKSDEDEKIQEDKEQDLKDKLGDPQNFGAIEDALSALRELKEEKQTSKEIMGGLPIPPKGTPEYDALKPILDRL